MDFITQPRNANLQKQCRWLAELVLKYSDCMQFSILSNLQGIDRRRPVPHPWIVSVCGSVDPRTPSTSKSSRAGRPNRQSWIHTIVLLSFHSANDRYWKPAKQHCQMLGYCGPKTRYELSANSVVDAATVADGLDFHREDRK